MRRDDGRVFRYCRVVLVAQIVAVAGCAVVVLPTDARHAIADVAEHPPPPPGGGGGGLAQSLGGLVP